MTARERQEESREERKGGQGEDPAEEKHLYERQTTDSADGKAQPICNPKTLPNSITPQKLISKHPSGLRYTV